MMHGQKNIKSFIFVCRRKVSGNWILLLVTV